jgi:hypothetical protein
VSDQGLPPRKQAAQNVPVSLEPRRRELAARVAELQWDLGGLVYEMAIRDHIRVELLVEKAAAMQALDAELGEVERVMRMEQAGAAGACPSCAALHSRGAAYCWQCGQALVERFVEVSPAKSQAKLPESGVRRPGAAPAGS